MSTNFAIPGVPIDWLKAEDLLWESILDRPLSFPPASHSHVAQDLPQSIAYVDAENEFTAEQSFSNVLAQAYIVSGGPRLDVGNASNVLRVRTNSNSSYANLEAAAGTFAGQLAAKGLNITNVDNSNNWSIIPQAAASGKLIFTSNNTGVAFNLHPNGLLEVSKLSLGTPSNWSEITNIGNIGSYKADGAQIYLGDLNFATLGYHNSAPGIGALDTGQGTAGGLAVYVYTGSPNSRTEAIRVLHTGDVHFRQSAKFISLAGVTSAEVLANGDIRAGSKLQIGRSIFGGGSIASPANATIEFYTAEIGYLAGRIQGRTYANNLAYGDLVLSANPLIANLAASREDLIIRGDTGHVGIGTSGPVSRLHVASSGGNTLTIGGGVPVLHLGYSPAGGLPYIDAVNTNTLDIKTGGIDRIRVANNGNVGIGNPYPAYRLDIAGSVAGGTFAGLAVSNFTSNAANVKTQISLPVFNGSTGGVIEEIGNSVDGYRLNFWQAQDGGSISFGTGGNNERMRITSSGKIGIGVTNPEYPLTIKDPVGAGMLIETTVGGNAGVIVYSNLGASYLDLNTTTGNNRILGGAGGFPNLSLWTANAERMRITDTGNVGIGTTSPGARLSVTGNVEASTNITARNELQVGPTGGNEWRLYREPLNGRLEYYAYGSPVITFGIGGDIRSSGLRIAANVSEINDSTNQNYFGGITTFRGLDAVNRIVLNGNNGTATFSGSITNATPFNAALANNYTAALRNNLRIIGNSGAELEFWHDAQNVGQFNYNAGVLSYGTHTGGGTQTTHFSITPTQATFSGNVTITPSVTAPSRTFTMSHGTNTFQTFMGYPGFYDGYQIFNVNNTLRFLLSSDGATVNGDLLMMGSSAIRPFEHANTRIVFEGTSKNNLGLYAGSVVRIATNNSDRLWVSSSGSIGIGTSNPTARLHVYDISASSATSLVTFQGQGGYDLALQSLNNSGGTVGNRFNFNIGSSAGEFSWSNSLGSRMRINSAGDVHLANDIWHKSLSDSSNRFYFSNAGGTVFRSHGSGLQYEFRNSADTAVSWIDNSGTMTVTGASIVRQGYLLTDSATANDKWYLYTLTGNNQFFIRDMTNARMHVVCTPAATAGAAVTNLYSRLFVDSNFTCQENALVQRGSSQAQVFAGGSGPSTHSGVNLTTPNATCALFAWHLDSSTYLDLGAASGTPILRYRTNGSQMGYFQDGIFNVGYGGQGQVAINRGDSIYSGYLAWFRPNGTRIGYAGYDSGNNISFTNESSGSFAFNANLVSTGLKLSGSSPAVGPNTSDGTDNAALVLTGGGAYGPATRGPSISLNGLEYSSRPGNIELHTGLNGQILMGGEQGGGMVTSLVVRSTGSLGMRADAWHYSVQDDLERFRFSPSGSTIFKGHSTTAFEFFNASNQRISYIDSFGNIDSLGSASIRYGLNIRDLNAASSQWLLYKNVGDSQLYLRDLVNSRMHVSYLAGPNVDNSQTTFSTRVHVNSGGNDGFGVYSRFIVAGSDATAWGVNVENTGNGQAFITLQRTGTTPVRWYNYIPSASTDLRYYANAADRFIFTAGGSFTATGNVQGNSVNVGSNLQLQHSGYTLELWDPANIGLRTFKAGALIATYSVDATAMMITSAYHHRDPSTLVSKWLLYAPGNDNNWYFRDVMNGRMQMAFYPGTSSSAASTYIYSNLTVDSAVTVSGLLSSASVTTTGVISSATEFRLNNNTFSRVAQIDGAGGFGGGYNFNITGGTNRDSTGNVAGYYYTQNRIKFYAETSGAAGPISARAEIHSGGLDVLGTATINGYVYSQFRTLSADPTTLDIASGYTQLVKNTTSGEIRTWVNDGGTMKKSSAYT